MKQVRKLRQYHSVKGTESNFPVGISIHYITELIKTDDMSLIKVFFLALLERKKERICNIAPQTFTDGMCAVEITLKLPEQQVKPKKVRTLHE